MSRALACTFLLLCSCGNPQRSSPHEAQLSGAIKVTSGTRGDAYVYLYAPGEGPPDNLANPLFVSGVSDVQLQAGSARYLFSALPPNPYRLWSFLDVNRNFDGDVDVLSQPGAGDRVSSGIELNVQPGARLEQDVSPNEPVALEPPAFHVEGLPDGGSGELQISADNPGVISFALVSDDVGRLDGTHVGFAVSLIDRNGDNAPDDGNGDGIPDVYPQTFLRWLPKPGQTVPLDAQGNPEDVLLPLAFDPSPYLTLLNGDASKVLIANRLPVFLLPQAQVVEYRPGRGQVLTVLPAIPPGEYELLVIQENAQFWKLPNALGPVVPSQSLRFSVVRR